MSPIDQAREFVLSAVQRPALEHASLDPKIKAKVRHSNLWLEKFERVGDLLIYLQRFNPDKNDPIYQELKSKGLYTFEDIVGEFQTKFAPWAGDCTRATDFIIGKTYTSFEILIFARNYDTRSGGIFVNEVDGKPCEAIIKATLTGGTYANAWLTLHQRLKYYLKSINQKFDPKYKSNSAILNNRHLPIYTFVRENADEPFTYEGVFRFAAMHEEENGAKWFELDSDPGDLEVLVDEDALGRELNEEVARSRALSPHDRAQRLLSAPRLPQRVPVKTTAYRRNPDVIATVLERAKRFCELCHEPAPFSRRSDGEPYLEVHHRIPLAQQGEDTVANAIALCPNCHRESHYG